MSERCTLLSSYYDLYSYLRVLTNGSNHDANASFSFSGIEVVCCQSNWESRVQYHQREHSNKTGIFEAAITGTVFGLNRLKHYNIIVEILYIYTIQQ